MDSDNDTSQVQLEVPKEGGAEGAEEKAEPSKEAQPSEEQKEAGDVKKPKSYTEEELKTAIAEKLKEQQQAIYSAKDKEIAAERKARIEAERKSQELDITRRSGDEFSQMMQVLAREETEQIRTAETSGLDTTPIKRAYGMQRQALGMAYQSYLREQQTATTQRIDKARNLIYANNLPEDTLPELLKAQTDQEMMLMAKTMKLEGDLQNTRTQQASKEKQPQSFSKIAPAPGGDSDEAFMKKMGDSSYSPTREDYERNRKILERLVSGG